MKIRLMPTLSIGIALILIGSLAYAADRKKKTNSEELAADNIQEEKALTAELLNAVENHEQKIHDSNNPQKVDVGMHKDNNIQLIPK